MAIDRATAVSYKPFTRVALLISGPGALYAAIADKQPLELLFFPLFFSAVFLFCVLFWLFGFLIGECFSSIGMLIEVLLDGEEKE